MNESLTDPWMTMDAHCRPGGTETAMRCHLCVAPTVSDGAIFGCYHPASGRIFMPNL